MPSSNPSRAAAKRLDRFITSHGDELLSLPKATQDHLIDLVWNGHSARARMELADAVAAARAKRSAAARKGARTRLVEPILKAYRAVRPQADVGTIRKNVARNADPELSKIIARHKNDPTRLGQELLYRASTVGRHSDFISGAFYHGKAAV